MVLQPANATFQECSFGHSWVEPYGASWLDCTWRTTQPWFPSLLRPTQAQRFLNCAPLINSSKPTLGDSRVVFATQVGSRHVVRKENTYTQAHHNLSKCSAGETCVPVFHTKTGLLLLITFCALKFFFQESNKQKKIKPLLKKNSQEKLQIAVNMTLSVTNITLCWYTSNTCSLQREREKKVSGNLIANRIILQE